MNVVAALPADGGLIGAACGALGLSRASFHRRTAAARRPPTPIRPRPSPARALADPERRAVLDLLREPRFVDQAPAEEAYPAVPGSSTCSDSTGLIG
jgi:putative transposase